MTLRLRYAARSDRGLVRSTNQDSVYAGPHLLAVADGMGGHAAGEVASKMVIGALAHLDDHRPGTDVLTACRMAVHAGNNAIAELVGAEVDLAGMGTTLTAILFDGQRMTLMHIGDSRAYLLRDGGFTQITRDDTYVQALMDAGQITPEQAVTHPMRSYLQRALNGEEVEPTLAIREARVGDRLLLCSDGVSGVLTTEVLNETIRIEDPHACADRLVELALHHGGPDNLTIIVADVVATDTAPAYPPVVTGAAAHLSIPNGRKRGRRTIVLITSLIFVVVVAGLVSVWL